MSPNLKTKGRWGRRDAFDSSVYRFILYGWQEVEGKVNMIQDYTGSAKTNW